MLVFFMEFQVGYFNSVQFALSQYKTASSGSGCEVFSTISSYPQGYILDTKLFLLYINDRPDDVICSIAVYAGTTLYSMRDQAFNL